MWCMVMTVEVMGHGDSIIIGREGREMTAQQAAGILNVSRQYLVRLLDEGSIPYINAGESIRLRREDVLAFKGLRDERRRVALDELTKATEELGGYDELK